MRTRIVKFRTIKEFWTLHPQSKTAFEKFVREVKNSDWNNYNDVKNTFPTADFLGKYKKKNTDRVVFDIDGKKFRIIAKLVFKGSIYTMYICFIGTHAEYSKVCKANNQYTINLY